MTPEFAGEQGRRDLRLYGRAACVLAAAWPDLCTSPADTPSPLSGDGAYEDVVAVLALSDVMEAEQLAGMLDLDVAAIAAAEEDLGEAIGTRIIEAMSAYRLVKYGRGAAAASPPGAETHG